MREKAYTVVDTETVKNTLQLDYSPNGLFVTAVHDSHCVVTCIPPTGSTREGLQVDSDTLQDIFETGAIKLKET